ncbi:exporter of polyketide antibiotics [Nonomuraea rosea]|uniref:Exporter of polyketide antibiotics n=1 Tax=Nonomuraea rosea TaxID=638574 RepID=A0ABP6W7C4_9ACTN
MIARAFSGTLVLAGLVVRRDRGLLAAWIAVAVAVPLFNAYSLGALLPTPQARADFAAASAANPVTATLLGPINDLSIEGVVAWRSSLQSLLIAGLAGLLFAIRHTRAEEDAGRRELTAAGAIGRQAALTAVLVVVAVVNAAVTLLLTAALALGPGYDLAGSLLFSLTAAAGGLAFAGCGLVTAQLAQSAARARSVAVGVLVAGVMPGVMVPDDRIGLLPAGWPRIARPYAAGQWWVPLVPLALTVVLLVAAYALSARRDLGAGLLRDRGGSTGPVRAGRLLRGPATLAWRLSGGQVASWTLTLAALSVAVGWVSASFDARFGDLPLMGELLGGGDALLAIFTYVFCLVVACLTVVCALRPYAEESRGRAAPLLAAPTGRTRWLAGHVGLGLAAPAVMLLAVGLGTGLGSGLSTGRPWTILAQTGTALLFVPAAWTIAGLTIALYGLRPRLTVPASWVAVVVSVAFVALWEARVIGREVFLVTPFGYGHPTISPGPVAPAAFALFAAVLVAVGGAAFRRRDLIA